MCLHDKKADTLSYNELVSLLEKYAKNGMFSMYFGPRVAETVRELIRLRSGKSYNEAVGPQTAARKITTIVVRGDAEVEVVK